MTANDLIKLALKTAGPLAAGQTATAEEANDALILLNSMLASWQQKRYLVYHLVDLSTPSTNAVSYTIGPGGNFDSSRPDRIQKAYARQMFVESGASGPIDYPLNIINTYEAYADIALKHLNSFPSYVFYDAAPLVGNLYFWPIPSNQFELHVVIKDTLQHFDSIDDAIAFPPEYFEALHYNLAARIQIMFQLPVNPGVVALAKASLNTIRIANQRVPLLQMPTGLGGRNTSGSIAGRTVVDGVFTIEEDLLG